MDREQNKRIGKIVDLEHSNHPVKRKDPPDTEFSAEVGPAPLGPISGWYQKADSQGEGLSADTDKEEGREEAAGAGKADTAYQVGWIALILAIASTLVLPGILGSAAIVAGAYAYFRGRKALGGWAIVIGLISVAAYLMLVPYYS